MDADILECSIRALGERRQITEEGGQRLFDGGWRFILGTSHELGQRVGGKKRNWIFGVRRMSEERQEILIGVGGFGEGLCKCGNSCDAQESVEFRYCQWIIDCSFGGNPRQWT